MAYVWSRPRYYGKKYATTCCIEVSKKAGTYIKSFTTYAGQLQLPYQDKGSLISVGINPRILKGAVWYHKPTSPYDEPDTQSKLEYNMKDFCVAPNNMAVSDELTESFWSQLDFEFDPPSDLSVLDGTVCYCGFYSPYDSSNSTSNFCHPTDNSKADIYNMATIMTSTPARGLIIKAGTLNPVPPISKPTISITDYTQICRYDNNAATIKWSKCDNASSKTYLDINGVRVNQNSGDGEGSFTFKPSDYSVTAGSSYTVKVYRTNAYKDANGNDTIVSASTTMYTYSNPSLSDLAKIIPTINANETEKFTWVTTLPKWKSKNLEKHVTNMTINGNNVSEVNDNSEDDSTSVEIQNIGKYVKFDKDQKTGQEVEVVLTKSHKNDINVPVAKLTTKIKVVRIPTQKVNKNSSSFIYKLKMKNQSDPKHNTSLAENATVDRETSAYINVTFTYPSNKSTEHYGIVNGYHIVVRSQDNSITYEEYYETNDLSVSYDIPVNKIKFSLRNTLEITPYYKHSRKDFNETIDNNIYLNTDCMQSRAFPSVVTRLGKPVINYPTEKSTWINKNIRLLFQLPSDGDYNNYDSATKTNYIYRDIQLEVVANNITKTYLWTGNNEIFSLNKLAYQRKIAINPSLMSTYQNATTYKFRIRVRKNYGYSDSYSEESWSDWSDYRTVYVKTMSQKVNQGDYIMATHHNAVYDFISRMKTCYKDSQKPIRIKRVNVGDRIEANPFNNPYNDILDVFNLVNNWQTNPGEFAKKPVKFNNGNNLTQFVPQKGVYITDLVDDTTPTGDNYMIKLHNIANLLK